MKVCRFYPDTSAELEPLPTIEERVTELEKRMQRVERIQKYGCKCQEDCA